ncbi:MAG TPA: protein kinase, partial [Actinotalea sp.]|nr:protein kinase [Actinotalea sp.]
RREARAAARLTHHGLVAVHDQGVDGDTSYLTMEYVEGTNLRRRLAEEGALTVRDALLVAEEVLDALTAAHQTGLVHRDIKPENVLLGAKGRVKVADFGLARAITEVTSTSTGTILGTVGYLAPELVAHGHADTRTDVYAVGILLFEMITGTQPFSGATPIQVAYQHVHHDVPAPSDRERWLPVEVDELVGALAAREPSDRPADAGAALELVRRTRDALDEATLRRRAESDRAPTAPAGGEGASGEGAAGEGGDPDATERLDLREIDQDAGREPMSRTIALKIGSGVDDAPDRAGSPAAPGRRNRRRLIIWVVGALVVLAALAGAAWWYQSDGPGAYTTVPSDLVGMTRDAAAERLASAGLAPGTETEVFDAEVPAGVVVASRPGPGEQVRRDGTVGLDVSKGPELSTVPPELAGKPLEEVVVLLEAARFVAVHDDANDRYDDAVPAGVVLSVDQAAGASLPVGTDWAINTAPA